MGKTGVLLSLLVVGLALASIEARHSSYETELENRLPKSFRSGHEYVFEYNGQIALGLVDPTLLDNQPLNFEADIQREQKAATRVQSQVKIVFNTERHATLRLEHVRLGQVNTHLEKVHTVLPMGMFEKKSLDETKLRELQLPCEFVYVDGVIERIQYHPEDKVWSKNIKRAVLNLIQLNLKPVNEKTGENSMSDDEKLYVTKAYSTPEITIEGDCQTTYTINSNSNVLRRRSDLIDEQNKPLDFNVTKSIDFKHCKKVADIGFGFQIQPDQHPLCVQCMQKEWLKTNDEKEKLSEDNFYYKNSCAHLCDPKEIKNNYLERSTVMRAECFGRPEDNFAVKRSEIVSHYVYKTTVAETNVENSKQPTSAIHAIVVAELKLKGENTITGSHSHAQLKESSERDQTIMYDNEVDAEEKRFYMYGDEEFGRHTPFRAIQNKVETAINFYRRILQAASDKVNGIESEIAAYLPRLIETLRWCSVEELEKITKTLVSQKQQFESEKEKAKQILADTLVLAGTRNTIAMLVKLIENQEISTSKAVHAVSMLRGLPAPSDSIVEILLKLVKSEQCRRFPALKQSTLLSVGTLISEVCRHKSQHFAQRVIYGTQSGFDKEEVCPRNKKEAYKQALLEQYEQAETTYEKVLVLKAFGNAGLDITVSSLLESVIRGERTNNNAKFINEDESVIVRIHAIDALRRLTTQMPRKIQRLLLPIFQNGRERPEVRLSAFTILMLTNPERPILDQVIYTLTKERSEDVRAFVYTTLKTLSNSVVPAEQELAKYLQTALKWIKIDETLVSSTFYRVPFMSGNDERNSQNVEGIILQLASMFRSSENQMLPTHISAAVHTIFNEEFQLNSIKFSASQMNLNRWAENLMSMIFQMSSRRTMKNSSPIRAERDNVKYTQQADEELRGIFSDLKIKRRSYDNKVNRTPFGMICVRVGDIDKVILPLDEQTLPEAVKMVLNGERPSLSSIGELKSLNGNKKYYRILSAMSLNEKIASVPTSCGLPLRILHTQPILSSIDSESKMQLESESLFSAKALLNTHFGVSGIEIRRMEVRVENVIAVGVESMRAVEAHLPINAELKYNLKDGLKLSFQTPKVQKTRLFGLHTLTITYTRDFDSKIRMFREPKLKAIHTPHLEPHQVTVNEKIGERVLGLPIRINGHYYLPSKSSGQSVLDYFVDMTRISLCSENHLHITFEPTEETPREIEFSLQSSIFENLKADSQKLNAPSQKFRNFYSNKVNQFDATYPEESVEATETLEDYSKRSEFFKTIVNKFDDAKMYKHSLKVLCQTVGGRKQFKSQMELSGICDARFKYCKLACDIKRSPMLLSETEWWTLNANAEILAPHTVSSPAELDSLKTLKNQRFVAHAEVSWGSEKKQNVNLRIQGESANVQQLKKLLTNEIDEEDKLKIKRELAFLNKYDVVAKYQLDAATQNLFMRFMELIKSYKPWSTESQLLTGVSGRPLEHTTEKCSKTQECEFHANLIIEPITQRYCNISMRTISQAVRITSIPLPYRVRPFVLVRAEDKPTHSAMQVFSRIAGESRAECVVDGRRVETFDGVQYSAPINKCYSVLAKDCGSEKPKFSVLMKALDKAGKQKSLKVLSRNQVIECEPKMNDQYKKLTCKVNGEEINQEQQYQENVIEYNNEEQTSVDITLDGVRVRFACLCSDCKCQKATVKLAEQFKHSQCGLCGHYDDSTRDEFRMNNDEETDDLTKFHRSFSLVDKEECSPKKQDAFYSEKREQFSQMRRSMNSEENWENTDKKVNQRKSFTIEEENDWTDGGYATNDEEETYAKSTESFKKFFENSVEENDNEYYGKSNKRDQSKQMNEKRKGKKYSTRSEEPVLQTIVTEYNHRICFSVEPVKQCVDNTRPAWTESESDEELSNVEKINVDFVCLKRMDSEARRMLREARRGVILNVSEFKPNYKQKITPVQKCVNY